MPQGHWTMAVQARESVENGLPYCCTSPTFTKKTKKHQRRKMSGRGTQLAAATKVSLSASESDGMPPLEENNHASVLVPLDRPRGSGERLYAVYQWTPQSG